MIRIRSCAPRLALLVLLMACNDGMQATAPRSPGGASASQSSARSERFDRYVAMGYSISMGFMSGGVYHGSQVSSWPAQLAQLAGIPFTQPLIDAPGCGAPLFAPLSIGLRIDGTAGNTPVTVCSALLAGITPPTQNLAITNALAQDALLETPQTAAAKRPFRGASYSRVLGPGQTQVTAMRAQAPHFVSVDLAGSELIGARLGLVALRPAGSLVPYEEWLSAYDEVVENVKAAGAKALLVGFASDFSLLAGLRRGDELHASRADFEARHVIVDPACGSGDRFNLVYVPDKVFAAVAAGKAAFAIGGPPAALRCANVVGAADGVLTPAELAEVNAMQNRMNEHVRQLAESNGYAFVSYDDLLTRKHFKPPFNLAILLGSNKPYGPFLSLDDLHPNGVGSRIMAQAAARALNRTYHVSIPVDGNSGSDWRPAPGNTAPRRALGTASVYWNQLTRSLVSKNVTGQLPALRGYALVSVAQLKAILSVTEQHTGSKDSSPEAAAAAAAAAATVLSYLYPADQSLIDEQLREQEAVLLTSGEDVTTIAAGKAAGRAAGAEVVSRARLDGFNAPWVGTVPIGSSYWRSSAVPPQAPVAPQVAQMRAWFLASNDQFRPTPPTFGSPDFLAGLAVVRQISDTRTPEQARLARKWEYGPRTVGIAGYWNEVASGLIAQRRLGELGAARVLSLANMAAMDAAIACWDAKYAYWLIRPSQADPAITLAITLPNHPSYVSGHSSVSAAYATVLSDLFPSERAVNGAIVEEIGLSRVYGGLHYPFDIEAGKQLGITVAQLALRVDAQRRTLMPD